MPKNKVNKNRMGGRPYIIVIILLILGFIFFNPLAKVAVSGIFKISTGGGISIGKLNVKLNSLYADNIRIYNKEKELVLQAKSVNLRYDFFNIFKNRDIISSAEIAEPSATLRRLDAKKWNTSSLFKPKPKKKPPVKYKPIYRGALIVKNGKIIICDPVVAKTTQTLTDINISYNYFDKDKTIEARLLDKNREEITASGSIEKNTLRAKIKCAGINLKDHINFIFANGRDFIIDGGRVSAQADIFTDINKGITDYQGVLSADNLIIYSANWPRKFSRLCGNIDFFNNCLFAGNLTGTFGDVPVTASGTLSDFTLPYLDIHIEAPDFRLSSIEGFWTRQFKTDIDGWARATVDITGKADFPVITADLSACEISQDNNKIINPHIRIDLYKQIVFIRDFSAGFNGGSISARGQYFTGKPESVLVNARVENFPITQSIKTPAGKFSANCKSDLDICIVGAAKEPLIIADVRLKGIDMGAGSLGEASAHIIYDNNLLCVNNAKIIQDNKVTARLLGFADIKNKTLVFEAYGRGLTLKARDENSAKIFTARLNAAASVTGSQSSPVIASFVKNSGLNCNAMFADGINLSFYADSEGSLMGQGSLRVGDSPVSFGYFRQNPGRETLGYLEGRALDLNALSRVFLGMPFPLFKNKVSADIYLDGSDAAGYFYSFAIGGAGGEGIKIDGLAGGGSSFSTVRARGIDIAKIQIPQAPPRFLTGIINLYSIVQTKLGGKEKKERQITSQGSFNLSGGSIASLPVESGYYEAGSREGRVTIDTFTLFGKSLLIDLEGMVSKQAVSLKYVFIDRNLNSLKKAERFIKNKNLISVLNTDKIKFEILSHGSFGVKNKSLEFSSDTRIPGGLLDDDFFTMAANLKYSAGALYFNPLVFYQDDGTAKVEGVIGLNGKKDIRLILKTNKLDIKKILGATALASQDIEGKLTSDFSLSGKTAKPGVDAHIDILKLKLFGRSLNELKLGIHSEKNQYTVSGVKAVVNKGEIYGFGTVNKNGSLDFTFSSGGFPADELPFVAERLRGLQGLGKINLKITGTPGNPNVLAKLEYQNILVNDTTLASAIADFGWNNNTLLINQLYLEDVSAKKPAPAYTLKGSIYFPEGKLPASAAGWTPHQTVQGGAKGNTPLPELKLNFGSSSGRLSTIFALLNLPVKDKISGDVDLSLLLEGALSNPHIVFKGLLKNGMFEKIPVLSAAADMEIKDGLLTINDFNLKQPGGAAVLSGYARHKQSYDLSLKTDKLDMAMFSPFIPGGHRVGGVLTSNLAVKGEYPSGVISSNFSLAKGYVDNFNFDEFSGAMRGEKGYLYFNGWRLAKDKHLILGEGKMPIVSMRRDFYSAAPMDFTVKFSENDLSILNIFGNYIQSSSGQINGEVKFFGPVYEIKMKGAATVKKGQAVLTGVDTPVENINVKISFTDNKLLFDSFEGKMGGGNFKLSGDVTVDKLTPKEYNLALALNNLQVASKKYYTGTVNGNLALNGTPEGKTISGSLKSVGGNLNLPDFSSLKNSSAGSAGIDSLLGRIAFLNNLSYNVDLILDKVWLNNRSSALKTYFKSTGLLEVRGKNRRPTLKGQINFSQGSIDLYNTTFKVIDGLAFFDGNDTLIPKIDLDARTKVSDVIIFVEITGGLDKPITSFTSDPPLTETQIASLLALKMLPRGAISTVLGAASLPQDMYNVLQASLVQMLAQSMSQSLFYGSVDFEYGGGGLWSVKIAKAMDSDDKFYATFSRIYNISGLVTQAWGIEYKLQKRTVLTVEQDDYGNYFFGIKARWQY